MYMDSSANKDVGQLTDTC